MLHKTNHDWFGLYLPVFFSKGQKAIFELAKHNVEEAIIHMDKSHSHPLNPALWEK